MGQPGNHPEKDGQPHFFRKTEGFGHQIIAFLLVGRFQDGYQGEFSVEAGILLVLGRMHGRIVGRHYHQSALYAGDAGIHKGIGTDVHSHVLHAYQRALARIGHAQGRFHGRFFVGAPAAADAALAREGIRLDELRNLRGRGSRIGIHPRQAGMQSPQRHGLISQQ